MRKEKYPIIEGYKICNRCLQRLPIENFYKKKNGTYEPYCYDCKKANRASYYKNNKEKENVQSIIRNKKWIAEHKEQYNEYMMQYARRRNNYNKENFRGHNDGRYKEHKKSRIKFYNAKYYYGLSEEEYNMLPDYCQVCGSTERLCIDHDHKTGKVRGVLCSSCNCALGFSKDNPTILEGLKQYLINSLKDN